MFEILTEIVRSVGVSWRHVGILNESGTNNTVFVESDDLLGTGIGGIHAHLQPIGDIDIEVGTERGAAEVGAHTDTILV